MASIESTSQELQTALMAVAEELYKNAPQDANAPNANTASNNDNVKDADFEEIK